MALLVFLIGTQVTGEGPPVAHGDVTSAPTTAAELPTAGPVVGVNGRRFDVTNPINGVHAVMSVAEGPWGSQISLILDGVRGPLRCELVAIGRDGRSSVVSSWNVNAPISGTPNGPDPLLLQAATAMALRDIREFRIRGITLDGSQSTLITLVV